jgi:hypothetical protein
MIIKNLETIYKELEKDEVDLQTKYQYSAKKTGNRVKNMSLGRIWLNILLPDNYKLVDEPVDKKVCNKIFLELLNKFGPEVMSDVLTTLNKETFKLSTLDPVTFNSRNLVLSDNLKKRKKEELMSETDPVEFSRKQRKLGEELVSELADKGDGVADIVKAGIGKASPVDLSVLMVAKGSTLDIEGNTSKPIKSAVSDGFNLKEYYSNAGESRRNLHIRSVGAAQPGALSRQIAYAISGIVLSSRDDCKTRKYLQINGKNSQDRIIGRYWLDPRNNNEEMITPDTKFPTGMINLRSPIYCRDRKGICKKCYGDLASLLDTKNIGMVAANVLNKVGVEIYSMAARHKSTQISIRKTNFKKDLVKQEG